MKLVQIKCDHLRKAKKVIASDEYLFVLTGQSVVILKKDMEYVKTITGFRYTYNGHVSPDGKQLLLISNEPVFYIISIETLEMTARCRLKGNVEGIEGQGCWSLDGKSVLLIVMNKKNYNYFLRSYPIDNLNEFSDYSPVNNFRFVSILSVPHKESIYILGNKLMCDYTDLVLLQLKNNEISENKIEGTRRLTPMTMEYNQRADRFVVYTIENAFTCDLLGKNVRMIDTGIPKSEVTMFSMPLIIKHILESKDRKYLFMASTGGLDIFDKSTGELLYSKDISFGAENVFELKENMIIVGMYGGSSRLYEIKT